MAPVAPGCWGLPFSVVSAVGTGAIWVEKKGNALAHHCARAAFGYVCMQDTVAEAARTGKTFEAPPEPDDPDDSNM